MKLRLVRGGVIAAEIAGIIVATVIAGAAFLFWRVQAAPVDISWAASALRAAANAAGLNDAVRKIDEVEISKAANGGGYRLTFANVSLGGEIMEATAELPKVVVEFHPIDIFAGKVGPRRIQIEGAELRIVRRSDRKLRLDFGAPTAERARVFESLTGGAYFREAFERAALQDATITFIDDNSGRTWVGRSGKALIERTADGYAASLNSSFEIGARAAALSFVADYNLAADIISSKLSLVDAPVGDLIAVLFNENAELFTSPVSGAASIEFNSHGEVLSSKIDIEAGAGVLKLGAWSTSVSSMEAAAGFDPRLNKFNIDRIEWEGAAGRGALAGTVSLDAAQNEKGIARLNFSLDGKDIKIDQPAHFSETLLVDSSFVEGTYDLEENIVSVSRIAADFVGVKVDGRFSVAGGDNKSPAVTANLKLDGTLDPETLLKIWPKGLAKSARGFVETRMPNAEFSNVDFTMNLKEGAIAPDGAIPDDSMTLAFRADNAEVIYAPGMSPMTKVSGVGALKGNSFSFNAEKGEVGAVRIGPGEVEIPVLVPKGQPSFFRFSARGDAGDILEILSQEPLAVLAGTNFSADQFSGPVRAKVEIQRPNLALAPEDSYRYHGLATFEDLAIDSFIGDASITGGEGKLDLATDGMVIKGDARVGDAPVAIEWRQRFFGDGDKTVINFEGTANSATADLFGIPTRQMVQGAVPFKARAVGGVDAFRELELDADLTGAVLVSESLGWLKPQGTAAKAFARFSFSPEGTKVTDFSLEGDGVSIRGEADFAPAGAVRTFNIPTFDLESAANLSMSGMRDANGFLSALVSGKYLSAGEMVRTLVEGGAAADGKTPFALAARIDRLDLRAGAEYRNASLDFSRDAALIQALKFSATGAAGAPISVELKPANSDGGEQTVEARSDDVGAMLGGIFGLTSVKGGAGRLDFTFTPGAEDAPKTGALEAHGLRVVKAPLLAKIFAAGSLTGLSDLMNGDGIELRNAMAKFALEDGEIRVSEARATGPSVGITAQGSFGLEGDRTVSLIGAVAPAYGVNSLLGKAPVIGDLFVSRKGEGLLALSYDVAGPASEPRVTVNPLSAFAPGVFRRMFEGGGAEVPAPADKDTQPTDEEIR